MDGIVIKITDQIDIGIIDKVKALGKAGDDAVISIEALKVAIDTVSKNNLKDYANVLTQIVNQQSTMSSSAVNLANKLELLSRNVEKTKKAQADALTANQKLSQEYSKSAIQQQKLATEMYKTDVALKNLSVSQAKLNNELAKGAKIATDAELAIVRLSQAKNKLALDTATLNDRIAQTALRTKIMQEQLTQATLRTRDWGKATELLAEKNNALNQILSITSTLYRLFIGSIVINKITDLVDSYTLMQNRLQLVSTSTSNLQALQKELFKTAQDSRVPVVELTQSFVRYDYALKELGASQKESLRFTKTLSELLQISGLNTNEASSALLQLSQALNKGKLDGDEFRTIMETLPTLASAIAKEMGVARGELIKLAPEGKITTEILRKALATLSEDTDKRFQDLGVTVSQGFTVIKNGAIEFIGEFNKATGASKFLAEILVGTGHHLKEIFAVSVGVATFALGKYIVAMDVAILKTGELGIAQTALIRVMTPLIGTFELLNTTSVASGLGLSVVGAGVVALTSYILLNKDSLELLDREGAVLQDTFTAISKLMDDYSKTTDTATESSNFLVKAWQDLGKASIADGVNNVILLMAELADAFTEGGSNTHFFDDLVTKQEEVTRERLKALEAQKKIIDATRDEERQAKILADTKALILSQEKTTGGREAKANIEIEQIREKYDKQIEIVKKYFSEKEKLETGDRKRELQEIEKSSVKNLQNSKSFAIEFVEDGGKKGQVTQRKATEDALKRRQEILESLGGETKKYSQTVKDLNDLLALEEINQEQYNLVLSRTTEGQKAAQRVQELEAKAYVDTYESKKKKLKEWIKEQLISINYDVTLAGKEEERERQRVLAQNAYFTQLEKLDQEENKKQQKSQDRKDKELSSIQKFAEKAKAYYEKLADDIEEYKKKVADREEKLKESSASKVTNISNQGGNAVNNIFEQNKANHDLVLQQQIKERTDLKGHYDQLANISKEGEDRINAIKRESDKKDAQNRLKVASIEIGATSDLFNALGTLVKNREGESSRSAKRLFKISQALALAQAIVNTAESISEANKGSIYEKIPAITFAAATGATQIATIIGASLQGLANGGTVSGTGSTTSDSNLVRLSRGEEVIKASVAEPNRAFLKSLNSGQIDTSNLNRTFTNQVEQQNLRQAPKITIHNYGDKKVEVQHKQNGGEDEFIVMIGRFDDHLAQNISENKGKTAKVIKDLIGRNY